MAQATTASKNGATNKTAQTAQTSNTSPLVNTPALKVEIPKQEEQKPEPVKPVRTIQEELDRIRLRYDLADKLEQLVATKARLEQFRMTSGGLREKLILSDSISQEFTTSNTAVLEAVYQVICKTVDEKIASLEAELLATA